ncbi:MAG: Holliday junction resolvase RuvX [Candidatus Saccharibacteria bacterium]
MPAINAASVLSLDVGAQRIGVARASVIAKIASPLTTVINDAQVMETIANLIKQEDAGILVVGLPRNLQSQETAQTRTVQEFIRTLQQHIAIPVYFQDEALTSNKAEAELDARRKPYTKGDIDALAATYILDDFLQEQGSSLL